MVLPYMYRSVLENRNKASFEWLGTFWGGNLYFVLKNSIFLQQNFVNGMFEKGTNVFRMKT